MNTRLYYGLVDCNNFYASCERVFRPDLRHRPIVVLSNNDGCIIARDAHAKALGIAMGTPLHQARDLIRRERVAVFSSNYELYGDLSRRVMNILAAHSEAIEVYSIDEAFVTWQRYGATPADLLQDIADLRQRVGRGTGIPVCIGMGPTKTLAKLANRIAKKQTTDGVYVALPDDERVAAFELTDVWGIGRAISYRLAQMGIHTVADFVGLPGAWVRQEFGVVGLRTWQELRGKPCAGLEPPVVARKHTMVSRSFGRATGSREQVAEALATHTTRLAEKLRQYRQTTAALTVYLYTNRFQPTPGVPPSFARSCTLPVATSDTLILLECVRRTFAQLYQPDVQYNKAGVMAHELQSARVTQLSLLTPEAHPDPRRARLMATLDAINGKYGKHTILPAACNLPEQRQWRARANMRSPRYTTRWGEMRAIS